MVHKTLIIAFFIMALYDICYSQEKFVELEKPLVVKVDFNLGQFDKQIPYFSNFTITGEVPSSYEKLELLVYKDSCKGTPLKLGNIAWNRDTLKFGKINSFRLPVISLNKSKIKPNQTYCFCFEGTDMSKQIYIHKITGTSKTPLGDFTELNLGAGYSFEPQSYFGQVTFNLYFIPINDYINYDDKLGFWRHMGLRTSVYVGLSPITFSSEAEVESLTGLGNYVYGISFKAPLYWRNFTWLGEPIGKNMKLNVGVYNFQQELANPIVEKKLHKDFLYVGLSIDLDITNLLGPLGKALTK